jgi:F-type H+-transporting ATPase subunit b
MNKILDQLGELLLASIPTIVFLLITVAAYRFMVYKPLLRVLAERYKLTEGAFEQAKADIAAAEARTHEYEHRIRDARIAIFKSQEQRREQALKARYAIAAQARGAADARLQQYRAQLERETESARGELQQRAEQTATEIIRAILNPAGAQAGAR